MEKSIKVNEFRCHAASSELYRIVLLQWSEDIVIFCRKGPEFSASQLLR